MRVDSRMACLDRCRRSCFEVRDLVDSWYNVVLSFDCLTTWGDWTKRCHAYKERCIGFRLVRLRLVLMRGCSYMLTQSFVLLAAGMGCVFLFLALLVLCITCMSSLVCRFQPVPSDETLPVSTSPCGAEGDRRRRVAVIVAALQHHCRRRR